MIEFDLENPFPLIPDGTVSYRDEQAHAEAVDAWLGLKTASVEALLVEGFDRDLAREQNARHWIGLPVQSLLTPYTELRAILEKLNLRDQTDRAVAGEPRLVVDLGAGYGRMGFVIAREFPGVSFLGIEVVNERVCEGAAALLRFLERRRTPGSISLVQGDLSSDEFILPEAQIYFLYDFGSAAAIEKTLGDLRAQAARRSLIVVGRGGATRDAIERRHPWLSQVTPPDHFPHFSIYRSS